MPEELDINKIAVEFVNQHIESFYKTGKGIFKGAADSIRLRLDKSYKEYLLCVAERYSKAKSFFIRDEPTTLYKFYVPMDISCGGKRIKKTSFSELSSKSPFSVITGIGGSGKSILMRHLFLDAIIHKRKVPIFLELRRVNNTDQTILDLIKEALRSNHFNLDEEYIEKAIKAGHFAFLLDGYDEVGNSQRKAVSKQILQLAAEYDKNCIIVSSRPDNEFSGWQSFTVFQIDALTLDQACDLVEKLPFEADIKSKFLKDLRDRLFKKHESFLSNPLLLSIMLITYGENADIPKKLNVFYNQAYEALFHRHDALKGAFQRERSCDLDIQDFGRVFSVFSLQTYDKRTLEMSKSEALTFLEKSKKVVGFNFKENDYLQDAQQAVCLLIEDGLLITFAHRSFQEYFVAKFIAESKSELQQMLIDKYSCNAISDSVLRLLHEMNPELLERKFIIPSLEKLEKIIGIKKKAGMTHYLKFLKLMIGGFHRMEGGSVSPLFNSNSKWLHMVILTFDTCLNLIGIDKRPKYKVNKDRLEKRFTDAGVSNISISKLTTRDILIQEFATNSGMISKTGLEYLLEIKKVLIRKHEGIEHSLDEIFDMTENT